MTRAAGVPATTAVRGLRGELSVVERVAIDRQLDRLCGNVLEARQQLGPSEDVAQLPAEERMSLGFVAFLMRIRMESYLSAGLREAGMVSGDYALLSLLAVEGQLTPAVLARLVEWPRPPSGRAQCADRAGLVERRANPANSRSWLLQLTPAGWPYRAAISYAKTAFDRLDRALRDRHVDLVTLRQQIQILSSALRSLLPKP